MIQKSSPPPKACIIFKDNPLLHQAWCHITNQSMSILNPCMIWETSICAAADRRKTRRELQVSHSSFLSLYLFVCLYICLSVFVFVCLSLSLNIIQEKGTKGITAEPFVFFCLCICLSVFVYEWYDMQLQTEQTKRIAAEPFVFFYPHFPPSLCLPPCPAVISLPFTHLNHINTDQTRPDQTRPDQTRPDLTRPDQTRPDRVDPGRPS